MASELLFQLTTRIKFQNLNTVLTITTRDFQEILCGSIINFLLHSLQIILVKISIQ